MILGNCLLLEIITNLKNYDKLIDLPDLIIFNNQHFPRK